jgi:hypothetical protein
MINLEEKVERYINLRDKKVQLEALLDEKLKPLKEEMNMIENEILDFLNKTGQTSAKTKFGVPYKHVSKSLSVENADDFFKFIAENDAFDLLQKRIVSAVYEKYVEDGIEVPGIKVEPRLSIKIRRG